MLRNRKRMVILLLILTLFMFALLFRLLWIQLLDTRDFSSEQVDLIRASVEQRKETLVLDPGRGPIYDRNGERLTGTKQKALIVFPMVRPSLSDDESIKELAKVIDVAVPTLINALSAVDEPRIFKRPDTGNILSLTEGQSIVINQLQIPGITALPVTKRYRESAVARHVLGFIGQNPEYIQEQFPEALQEGELQLNSRIGVAGLEKSFDPFLRGVGPAEVSYFIDGKGRPLKGLNIRFHEPNNPFYPLSVVTTLDKRIQTMVENMMDESGIERGSVVVLDAESAEVRAMASRPHYDPSSVQIAQADWQNRALKHNPPGSIFKTVIAGAALESGEVDPSETFECSGEYGKYGFSCWKKDGHGRLTFAQAYAHSCNITFARVANRLGADRIEAYAEKLGVLQRTGWEKERFFHIDDFTQLDGEDRGQVFTPSSADGSEGVLIQTAIGQRDVRMTPLQAANMMVTIVNEGRKQKVRLVDEMRYKDGTSFHTFGPLSEPESKEIEPYTAYRLRNMMEDVVRYGTGAELNATTWTIAGKTGTAQTGTPGREHQWFAGYGPVRFPEYAVAVVAEDQASVSENQALKLFGNIMNGLAAVKD